MVRCAAPKHTTKETNGWNSCRRDRGDAVWFLKTQLFAWRGLIIDIRCAVSLSRRRSTCIQIQDLDLQTIPSLQTNPTHATAATRVFSKYPASCAWVMQTKIQTCNLITYIHTHTYLHFGISTGDAKHSLWLLWGSHKSWYPSGLAPAAPKTLRS